MLTKKKIILIISKSKKLASDDLIHCGSLICPKETVRCFSTSRTVNSVSKHLAQCIDETGHVLLGVDDKSVVEDLDGFLGDLFNYSADAGELINPSYMYSTPIANTESLIESSKTQGLTFAAKKQILEAQQTVDFWKNYIKRISLNLQGLSKSLEN